MRTIKLIAIASFALSSFAAQAQLAALVSIGQLVYEKNKANNRATQAEEKSAAAKVEAEKYKPRIAFPGAEKLAVGMRAEDVIAVLGEPTTAQYYSKEECIASPRMCTPETKLTYTVAEKDYVPARGVEMLDGMAQYLIVRFTNDGFIRGVSQALIRFKDTPRETQVRTLGTHMYDYSIGGNRTPEKFRGIKKDATRAEVRQAMGAPESESDAYGIYSYCDTYSIYASSKALICYDVKTDRVKSGVVMNNNKAALFLLGIDAEDRIY